MSLADASWAPARPGYSRRGPPRSSIAAIILLVAGAATSLPGRARPGSALTVAEIRGARRGSRDAQTARQAAMYLAAVVLELRQESIAAAFGRDRSTVGHSVRVIEDRRDDPAFDAWLTAIERRIVGFT